MKINKDGSQKIKEQACPVLEGEKTSNASLKFFYGNNLTIDDYINFSLSDRVLSKDAHTKEWNLDPEGHVLFVYQSKELNDNEVEYHARSFEDSFFHINKDFILENTCNDREEFIGNSNFPSLRQSKLKKFITGDIDSYDMAEGVIRKPTFAMEILINSKSEILTKEEGIIEKEFSNWSIPKYIEEGLRWLKID